MRSSRFISMNIVTMNVDLCNPLQASGRPVQDRASSEGRTAMQLYAILRRNGWRSPEDLKEAAARSARVGNEEMPDEVRWIRSYVLEEGGGPVGTVCIYEATGPEAIRKHASLADLPVDDIIPVADTVIVRPDPVAAAS
jgi:hypothetical protein